MKKGKIEMAKGRRRNAEHRRQRKRPIFKVYFNVTQH